MPNPRSPWDIVDLDAYSTAAAVPDDRPFCLDDLLSMSSLISNVEQPAPPPFDIGMFMQQVQAYRDGGIDMPRYPSSAPNQDYRLGDPMPSDAIYGCPCIMCAEREQQWVKRNTNTPPRNMLRPLMADGGEVAYYSTPVPPPTPEVNPVSKKIEQIVSDYDFKLHTVKSYSNPDAGAERYATRNWLCVLDNQTMLFTCYFTKQREDRNANTPPDAAEVLEKLGRECFTIRPHNRFEDWADEQGVSRDSLRSRQKYTKLRQRLQAFKNWLGRDLFEQILEAVAPPLEEPANSDARC